MDAFTPFERSLRPQLPYLPEPPSALISDRRISYSPSDSRLANYSHVPAPPGAFIPSKRISYTPSSLRQTPHPPGRDVPTHHFGPWKRYIYVGKLSQHSRDYRFYMSDGGDRIMVKKESNAYGDAERKILSDIYHRNITNLHEIFLTDKGNVYLTLDTCEYSLDELVRTKGTMNEGEVHLIAKSIFSALQYLSEKSLAHLEVKLQSIRICSQDGRILLANFENTKRFCQDEFPNCDLEGLGLIILSCVNGEEMKLSAQRIRMMRKLNRVYGLTRFDPWIGDKDLVDFLDILFDKKRLPHMKYKRTHPYVERDEMKTHRMTSLLIFVGWIESRDFESGLRKTKI